MPEKEQRRIVDEALIPALRDGDVGGSFDAGLERLRASIVNGRPTTGFEDFAADATVGWLPWTLLGLALAGLAGGLALYRRRERTDVPDEQPRTIRPDDLSLELVGVLIHGSPSVLAMPAALLELAARGALVIEPKPETEGKKDAGSKVQVRLLDRELVRSPLEEIVWARLAKLAQTNIVNGKSLQRFTSDQTPVQILALKGMRERGWGDQSAFWNRTGLWVGSTLCFVVGIVGAIVVSEGGRDAGPAAIAGIVLLLLLGVTAMWMAAVYPTLTAAGQEAAIPWKAYKAGIEQAAKKESMSLDLDNVLPDAVVMGLGRKLKKRIKAATAEGVTLQAFRESGTQMETFAMWTAYSSSTGASGEDRDRRSPVAGPAAGAGRPAARSRHVA